MLWNPRAILLYVREAGFRIDEQTTAVAVVLACSGGDDLYRDVSWPGPAVDARGLFGLDVVLRPDLAGVDLFDPRANCRAARGLSVAADGGWQWAGAPVPAVTSDPFQAAMAAMRAGPRAQSLEESSSSHSLIGVELEHARALAGISDYVRSTVLATRGY